MFEARLIQSSVFRKILEAIKDLLNEAVFECTNSGIHLQAMDNSHVSLVSLSLRQDGFDSYRCDRNISLGISLSSLSKILKCSGHDDIMTIKSQDKADNITLIFESQSQDRVSDYQLRLMNLDQEHLSIPESDYACILKMPSIEFARICKDLGQFGECVEISCSKEGIRFMVFGELGSANIKLAQINSADEEKSVFIGIQEPMSVKFAIRYLISFTKATPLSSRVKLSMSPDVPLLVEYKIGEIGSLKYYLAPKVDDVET